MKPPGGSGKPWNWMPSIPSKPPPPPRVPASLGPSPAPPPDSWLQQPRPGLWLQQMSWRACNTAAPTGSASGQLQSRPSRWIPEPCRESDSSTRRRTPAGPGGAHNIKTRKSTVNRSNPAVTTRSRVCPSTAYLYILPLSSHASCPPGACCWSPSLDWRAMWDCSGPESGERVREDWWRGNAWELHFHSVRGDGEQSRSRGGAADDPSACQKIQRSPDSYWARAAHEWQQAAITLDSEAAVETCYLFSWR